MFRFFTVVNSELKRVSYLIGFIIYKRYKTKTQAKISWGDRTVIAEYDTDSCDLLERLLSACLGGGASGAVSTAVVREQSVEAASAASFSADTRYLTIQARALHTTTPHCINEHSPYYQNYPGKKLQDMPRSFALMGVHPIFNCVMKALWQNLFVACCIYTEFSLWGNIKVLLRKSQSIKKLPEQNSDTWRLD